MSIKLLTLLATPLLTLTAHATNRICLGDVCRVMKKNVVVASDGTGFRLVRNDDGPGVPPRAARVVRVASAADDDEFGDPIDPMPPSRAARTAARPSPGGLARPGRPGAPGKSTLTICNNDQCTYEECDGDLSYVNGKKTCTPRASGGSGYTRSSSSFYYSSDSGVGSSR